MYVCITESLCCRAEIIFILLKKFCTVEIKYNIVNQPYINKIF